MQTVCTCRCSVKYAVEYAVEIVVMQSAEYAEAVQYSQCRAYRVQNMQTVCRVFSIYTYCRMQSLMQYMQHAHCRSKFTQYREQYNEMKSTKDDRIESPYNKIHQIFLSCIDNLLYPILCIYLLDIYLQHNDQFCLHFYFILTTNDYKIEKLHTFIKQDV